MNRRRPIVEVLPPEAKPKPFAETIGDLAQHVATKAQQTGVTLAEATDALKALTSYYAILAKHKPPTPEDDADSFGSFRRDIEGHNGAAVRGDRGA